MSHWNSHPVLRIFAALGLIAGTMGCEGDAAKLARLQGDEAVACLPVFVEDSTAQARELAINRIRANSYYGSSAIAMMQADLEEAKRAVAATGELVKRYEGHPEIAAADLKAQAARRSKCELAKRALNLFMGGR